MRTHTHVYCTHPPSSNVSDINIFVYTHPTSSKYENPFYGNSAGRKSIQNTLLYKTAFLQDQPTL